MRKVKWNWKTVSVALFAVVLPVSLVITFQLLGERTRIAENVTLDPLVWTLERPKGYICIEDLLNASYTDDGLSATFHMRLADYLPKAGSLHYDTIRIAIQMNATTTNQNGYIESISVVFGEDPQPSTVDWITTRFKLELEEEDFDFKNLSLVGKIEGIDGTRMRLDGINNPTRVALSAVAEWGLLTSNTQSHQMEVAYEIVYYNGTAYKKAVQPFQLNILGAEE